MIDKCEYSLIIGIPTINSSIYIHKSLERYKKEIDLLPSSIRSTVFICLNGTNDNNKTKNEIFKFIKSYPELNVVFEEIDKEGKNFALNKIIQYAKVNKFDIIHFLDDDVYLKKGSIKSNIVNLITFQEKYKMPILVGSNFVGIQRNLKYFIDKNNNFLKSLNYWILHKIFIVPYKFESDRPRFCIGQSLCGFVKTYPFYPDDSTGIADDGFIGNYYALIGKKLYLEQGINPIIKPDDSIVYFNIATSYKEWIRQQVRIYVGVFYSYMYYEEQMPFFEDFFAWEYSVGKSFRRKGKFLGIRHSILKYIYRIFQKDILRKSNKVIKSKAVPNWCIATSTKE